MPALNSTRDINRIRPFLALCTGSLAVFICLYQHHFDWDITSFWSYILMSRHRCGKLLIVCTLWPLVEFVVLLADAVVTKTKREPAIA